jgi:hypothetical protein
MEGLFGSKGVVITNSMGQDLPSDIQRHSTGQEAPCLYRTQTFIAVLEKSHHWALSCANSILTAYFSNTYPMGTGVKRPEH